MAKAKDAGLAPIAQFNGGATGGLAFPLQDLMASYGPAAPINDWIFQKPGATIDTPSNLQATQHLEKWIKAGYFWKDVNAVDYATMMSRFMKGDGLFMFNGDWESGNLDKQMPGDVGFFLMPPAQAGGKQAAMSAPLTFGIGANAKNADCAATFLDWVATDTQARTIGVQIGGSHPMGPADAPMPPIEAGTVTESTLAAGAKIAEDNGSMDFIANATGAIYAKSWTPQPAEAESAGSRPRRACSRACRATTCPRSREADVKAAVKRRSGSRWAGWLFVLPAAAFYVVFVIQPLAMTLQYSSTPWDGIGVATWNGVQNYLRVFTDPDLFAAILNADQADRVLQRGPGAARAGHRGDDPAHRRQPSRAGGPHGHLPAAGHPAGRGRDHLELAAVVDRAGEPAPVVHRTGEDHPRLAGRLLDGAAGGRGDRRLGRSWACAPSCCWPG